MKKMFSTVALVCLLVLPAASYAQKIGFVSATQLFNKYAKAKGIDKMIEEKFGSRKKEIETMVSEIQEYEKEIKTNELMMTESKLKDSKTKLQSMVIEYRKKGMALEKELKAVRDKELDEFKKIVFEETQKYAKEKKYDLIINEGVMYADDNINITDDIFARINKASK